MDAPHGRWLSVQGKNRRKLRKNASKKSWKHHPRKQQLCVHLPPIFKTIQINRTRHAGHSWRNKDKIINDVLLWTPSHERISVGRPTWTYLHQLWIDTGCRLEDLPEAIDDRDEWRERERERERGGGKEREFGLVWFGLDWFYDIWSLQRNCHSHNDALKVI